MKKLLIILLCLISFSALADFPNRRIKTTEYDFNCKEINVFYKIEFDDDVPIEVREGENGMERNAIDRYESKEAICFGLNTPYATCIKKSSY